MISIEVIIGYSLLFAQYIFHCLLHCIVFVILASLFQAPQVVVFCCRTRELWHRFRSPIALWRLGRLLLNLLLLLFILRSNQSLVSDFPHFYIRFNLRLILIHFHFVLLDDFGGRNLGMGL